MKRRKRSKKQLVPRGVLDRYCQLARLELLSGDLYVARPTGKILRDPLPYWKSRE